MPEKHQNNRAIELISGLAFGIAFLMAVRLFGGYGRELISTTTAKYIFVGAGALALLLNLLSFQTGKHNPLYNAIYWGGSIILFIGLVFMLFKLPKSNYIILSGLVIVGISFFVPAKKDNSRPSNPDLLDD